jgi:hypothetical protein
MYRKSNDIALMENVIELEEVTDIMGATCKSEAMRCRVDVKTSTRHRTLP